MEKSVFEILFEVNVNDHVEKKKWLVLPVLAVCVG